MMRRLALLFGLIAVSCVHRVEPPTAMLDRAATRAASGSAGARDLALAGFSALLVDGDAAKARVWFDSAIAKQPDEPWALYGHLALAQRDAHPDRALGVALDLCERAPRHPLAVSAARVALDLAATARSLDDLLRARVPSILARGVEGDLAHLLRAALVNAQNVVHTDQAQVLADMGMATSGTLVGPFSAWHHLSMAEATPVEKTGNLAALGDGPYGALVPRVLHFADGRFSLSGEPSSGDVYVLALDVTVPARATFVLRTVSSMDHIAVLDGTQVLARLTNHTPASTLSTQALSLRSGTHRLVLRMAKRAQTGHLTVALQRADGRPAQVVMAPASGPAPRWDGVSTASARQLFPTAATLHEALLDEAGGALATWVAVRDGVGRDHDGAARLLALLPASLASPTLAMARADVALRDPAVPARVAHGRANRDLEAALAKDPGFVQAALAAAQLTLDDTRPLDALEQLGRARDTTKPGAPLLALEAHARLSMGLDAAAAENAREALVALPGSCDATLLLYDIARRRDAVAEADALLASSEPCPGYEARAAEHLRARGLLEQARERYATLLTQDESQAQVATTLSGVLAALKRFDEAVQVLEKMRALWPRNTHVLKGLGDVHEQAGNAPAALAVREAALRLDGADLALRRAVERAKAGRELLEQDAISTEDALKSWEPAPGSEEATSTYVLDAAAIEGFADGAMVDRIHIIQKALDQQGVQEIAEVQLPPDAVVLKLRTLKPDGRSLEPESIDGKDTVSLPGVQVGDFIEYEYLLAHPPRGPGLPGFTASNFYFQIARQPNARSTYVVRAPKGSGLAVDAHNVVAPKVQVEGDFEVFRHEERRVPPYIPEPGGPPSGNEWLPFVSVGTGVRGSEALLNSYADAFVDRGAVTWEVEVFARDAAKEATGIEAARRVYARVMEKLSGHDAGLSMSASASVAQDRGSRTWLLVASLRALGLDTRLAAVRTFNADPAQYVFPAELFNYVCVVVRLPSGPLWLDPLVRYAPFGELPEFALGGREAWLLPEPGAPAERLSTPPTGARVEKQVTLTMQLSTEGVLSGDGVETYSGFEATQLGEGLESMSPEQRDQALQSGLSRYFGGADLSSVAVTSKREVGGEVKVSYHFVAPRFARVDADTLVAGALTFPHMLGRRYLATPTRTTPLFIESTEASRVSATLTLPAGFSLAQPVGEVKFEARDSHFVRTEQQGAGVLTVTEDFRLSQTRISPKDYAAFAQFAGEVDLLQQRDLVFEKK